MEDFSKRGLGALPSPSNINNYSLSDFIYEADVPEELIVSPYTKESEIYGHVYDQEYSSACVAFASSDLQAINQWKEIGKYVRLSPGWIYGNRSSLDHQGEGMVPSQMLKHLCADGTPPYDKFKHLGEYSDCQKYVNETRAELLENFARPNRALKYIELRNIDEVKVALAKVGPVLICISVYDNFYKVTTSGIVNRPTGIDNGGHCMLCVGYTSKNTLLVKNSWGSKWGRKGICEIPFDYTAIRELWCVTDLERRVVKSIIPAQILNPGAFVVPVRAMMESLGADVDFKVLGGVGVATAIIPPSAKVRKMTIVEGSKDIIVEVV